MWTQQSISMDQTKHLKNTVAEQIYFGGKKSAGTSVNPVFLTRAITAYVEDPLLHNLHALM